MSYSESGSPDFYSSFLVTVTIRLSRLFSKIFACDKQMDGRTSDNADHCYIVADQLIKGIIEIVHF